MGEFLDHVSGLALELVDILVNLLLVLGQELADEPLVEEDGSIGLGKEEVEEKAKLEEEVEGEPDQNEKRNRERERERERERFSQVQEELSKDVWMEVANQKRIHSEKNSRRLQKA